MNFSFQLKPDEYETDTVFAVVETGSLEQISEQELSDFIFVNLTTESLISEFKKYSDQISDCIHLFRIEIVEDKKPLTGKNLYARLGELNFYQFIYKTIHFIIEMNKTSHDMDLYWEETVDSGFFPVHQLIMDQYENRMNLDLKTVADYLSSWTDFGHMGEGSCLVWIIQKLDSPKVTMKELAYLSSFLVCSNELGFLGGEDLKNFITELPSFQTHFKEYFIMHLNNTDFFPVFSCYKKLDSISP